MEKLLKIWENAEKSKIINSIIIIVASVVVYKIIAYILEKSEKKDRFKLLSNKKSRTYLKLIKSVIRYIFIVITMLMLLQTNGIDVSSVLAGVGVLGVVFGLAIQDWLKDVIRGSSILSDNYFSVGDVVKYKDIEGKVLVIGLKTTKIQDIRTSNVISIANRNIEEVEVVSDLIYITIPMPYEVPVKKAEKTVARIITKISEQENVESSRYLGVNDLAESSIKYLIEIKCNPLRKLQARRHALKIALEEMAKDGIEVPYNQLDIHQK